MPDHIKIRDNLLSNPSLPKATTTSSLQYTSSEPNPSASTPKSSLTPSKRPPIPSTSTTPTFQPQISPSPSATPSETSVFYGRSTTIMYANGPSPTISSIQPELASGSPQSATIDRSIARILARDLGDPGAVMISVVSAVFGILFLVFLTCFLVYRRRRQPQTLLPSIGVVEMHGNGGRVASLAKLEAPFGREAVASGDVERNSRPPTMDSRSSVVTAVTEATLPEYERAPPSIVSAGVRWDGGPPTMELRVSMVTTVTQTTLPGYEPPPPDYESTIDNPM